MDLAQSFRSRGVQGSIAIGNLAELLESEDELTRFTAAKVLSQCNKAESSWQNLIHTFTCCVHNSDFQWCRVVRHLMRSV